MQKLSRTLLIAGGTEVGRSARPQRGLGANPTHQAVGWRIDDIDQQIRVTDSPRIPPEIGNTEGAGGQSTDLAEQFLQLESKLITVPFSPEARSRSASVFEIEIVGGHDGYSFYRNRSSASLASSCEAALRDQ